MQPRQIGITLGAVVLAFLVAFGIGKATGGSGGGGSTAKAGEGTTPVELASAPITVSMAGVAPLPALKSAPVKKK